MCIHVLRLRAWYECMHIQLLCLWFSSICISDDKIHLQKDIYISLILTHPASETSAFQLNFPHTSQSKLLHQPALLPYDNIQLNYCNDLEAQITKAINFCSVTLRILSATNNFFFIPINSQIIIHSHLPKADRQIYKQNVVQNNMLSLKKKQKKTSTNINI